MSAMHNVGMKLRLPRPGIAAKLFIAIFGVCLTIAMVMGLAVHTSFEQGFKGFIAEREVQRAQSLANVVSEYYREHGDWAPLARDSRRWWRILRTVSIEEYAAGGGHRPPLRGPHQEYAPPPPFYLTDTSGHPIAGAPDDIPADPKAPRFAVELDGRTIGWLVRLPPAPMPDQLETRFRSQQLQAGWTIIGFSALLAALVSYLLTRMLLLPIRRLGEATRELAGGHFETRVAIKRHDELGQLASDFNFLAHALEQNERSRRDMIADISHDLRTPLAILRGELEAIQDGVRPLTPTTLHSLQSEVLHLQQLIDDLHELSLADVGALRYRMTRIDLAGLLRHTGQAWQEALQQAGIELQLNLPSQPALIQADPQRLTQLFNNLFDNSRRYTHAGGLLRITLTTPADAIRIDFDDTPPGVATEQLPRIFDRLFRAESARSRGQGGSGLGLALALRIAQAHDATISAMPSDLGGIRIRLDFPQTGAHTE